MKYIFPIFLTSIAILSFFCFGCNPSSSDQGTAVLRGVVLDTSLPGQPKVVGATVLLEQNNLSTTTNTEGIFILRNIPGGTYTLTVTKQGYTKYSAEIEIISDDTNQFTTVPLLFKKIYFYNDLTLDVNNAGKLMDPIGNANINSPDKDIQLIDTIIGVDTFAFIKSADLVFPQGYQTWFSTQKYTGYSQSEFDTLSMFRTEDGLMQPETRDFPNHDGILINVYNYQNAVWFFYLRGRGIGSKAVYGAMYLDAAWNDNGIRRVRVDIKINANGKYIFDLNMKK